MSVAVIVIIVVVVVAVLLLAGMQFRKRSRAARAQRHRRTAELLHERADQQRAEAGEEEARAHKLDPRRKPSRAAR
jgi:uncharacterized membrane protein